jgi:hypothetical protein
MWSALRPLLARRIGTRTTIAASPSPTMAMLHKRLAGSMYDSDSDGEYLDPASVDPVQHKAIQDKLATSYLSQFREDKFAVPIPNPKQFPLATTPVGAGDNTPLTHIVYNDDLTRDIKHKRWLREFFVYRKRWEKPLLARYNEVLDECNQDLADVKRDFRRQTRQRVRMHRLQRTHVPRLVEQRRLESFNQLTNPAVYV